MRNNNELLKLGYSAGLNVCFRLKKSVDFETGIQYSNKGYQSKFKDAITQHPDPTNPTKEKMIYNYHYLDVPLRAIFTFGKQKIRFLTSVGLSTNFFIQETITSVAVYSARTEKKTSSTKFDYNKINISPMLSIGIDLTLNRLMNLRIEPTFRYGLLNIINAPVSAFLYSSGLNMSYNFKINSLRKK
ncbi:MAG TPA: porin family protein [Saprospiraceae bacterium]|nr:porin family protein [Saprospiraceae bacterium]